MPCVGTHVILAAADPNGFVAICGHVLLKAHCIDGHLLPSLFVCFASFVRGSWGDEETAKIILLRCACLASNSLHVISEDCDQCCSGPLFSVSVMDLRIHHLQEWCSMAGRILDDLEQLRR